MFSIDPFMSQTPRRFALPDGGNYQDFLCFGFLSETKAIPKPMETTGRPSTSYSLTAKGGV